MDCFQSPGRRLSSLALAQQRLKSLASPARPRIMPSFPPPSTQPSAGARPNLWLWLVDSDALAGLGVHRNDVLVVDRALEPVTGNVVIVVADQEHHLALVERVSPERLHLAHVGADGQHQEVLAGPEEIELWGVISMLLRSML